MTSRADDRSEVERELADVSARYDAVERSLLGRQTDLKETLHDVKIYLEDLQAILAWLEDKEQTTPPLYPLPVDLTQAQERLDQQRRFHDELLGREEGVASLKRNAQQLVRSRENSSGHKDVRRTLRDLGKCHSTRACSWTVHTCRIVDTDVSNVGSGFLQCMVTHKIYNAAP